jgi:galacturan 1,4-alpha-galacturonidase
VAIGSLGQYQDEDSSVANVVVRDAHLVARNSDMHNSAYIKTWVGETILQPHGSYESAGKPNGGGHGSVTNVVFANFHLDDAANGPAINQDSGNNGKRKREKRRNTKERATLSPRWLYGFVCPVDISGRDLTRYLGSYSGTSNLLISNIAFINFTGTLNGKNSRLGSDGSSDGSNNSSIRTARVSCSTRQPCYNIDFRNISLQPASGLPTVGAQGECKHTIPGAIHGMIGKDC